MFDSIKGMVQDSVASVGRGTSGARRAAGKPTRAKKVNSAVYKRQDWVSPVKKPGAAKAKSVPTSFKKFPQQSSRQSVDPANVPGMHIQGPAQGVPEQGMFDFAGAQSPQPIPMPTRVNDMEHENRQMMMAFLANMFGGRQDVIPVEGMNPALGTGQGFGTAKNPFTDINNPY